MSANATAIIALIVLLILVFAIVIALAYNPAPAICVKEVTHPCKEDSAKSLLYEKINHSSLSPQKIQESPSSCESDAWETLAKLRHARSQKQN
jgi:hypothetical protein